MKNQNHTDISLYIPGITKIKNRDINIFWQRIRVIGTPTLLVELSNVQPLWKTFQQFLKVLSMQLLYNSAIPLMDIYPR